MSDKSKIDIVQIIKFCIVGASNTLVSLAVYYLFVFIDSSLYLIGYFVGFVVSVLNAYYWNNKCVFDNKAEKQTTKLLKTYLIYGFTTILSMVLLYILVDVYGISELISPIITITVTLPINYILNKFWTYKEKV